MDRREFLKTAAVATAASAIDLKASAAAAADAAAKAVSPAAPPVVVAVRNGDPASMFRKGIEVLGGMKAFVRPGQRVVVKPNIA